MLASPAAKVEGPTNRVIGKDTISIVPNIVASSFLHATAQAGALALVFTLVPFHPHGCMVKETICLLVLRAFVRATMSAEKGARGNSSFKSNKNQ